MLTQAVGIALVLLVFAAPFLLLCLAGRVQRARDERVGHQIAVTDAIHRELGAIVAPFVTRRGRNAWKVAMTAPLDRPVAVGRILAIAYDALASRTPAAPPEVSFVLTPSRDSIYTGGNSPGEDPSWARSYPGRSSRSCSPPVLWPPPIGSGAASTPRVSSGIPATRG